MIRWMLCWGLCSGAAFAQESSVLAEARRALDESIPQVAIQKLRGFLTSPSTAPEQRRAAVLILAEAQLAAGQHETAIASLVQLVAAGDPEARLLHAHALVAGGKWSDALPIYRALNESGAVTPAGRIGEAECLQALGETEAAIARLEPWLTGETGYSVARLRLANLCVEARQTQKARALLATVTPATSVDARWKHYIEARLLLADGQAAEANEIFEEVARAAEEIPESLLAAATLGITEARIALRGYDEADQPLEGFIGRYAESAFLEIIFRRLDQVYAKQRNPTESELQKWAKKPSARRAAFARYYVARMQVRSKKLEKALGSLEIFVATFPTDPLLPYVHLMQADLALDRRDLAAAERALYAAMRHARNDDQRAEIELRTGVLHYQQGEYLLAGNFFRSAAQRAQGLRENALFDAALASLGQKNYDRFIEDFREFSSSYSESALRSELILEQGLSQARAGDARAEEALDLFLLQYPTHPRAAEGRIALSELALAAGENAKATEYLRVVNEAPPSPVAVDHAAYLAMFLEDAKPGRKDEAVIALGQKFTREFQRSLLLPDVRMKLGQLYFRRDDFANAETQFGTLARETPASPFTETALFLAGEAAMRQINPGSVDRALALFEEVVKRDGPLKLYARQQQAIVQSRLGRESEAVTLYDVILNAQPPAPSELRFASLSGKGDNLLALGRKDPAQTAAALAAFDQLASQPGVTAVWRNRALYKKAKALEQRGQSAEAIDVFYDILNKSAGPDREYFWYYKAGFDAARIFEQQAQWKSAIGIYEKMAKIEGPRAAEAMSRVKQLRLEKFLWE